MSLLFVTFPHTGEEIPPQAPWLKGLPENILMCDVDRFVDRLYEPVIQKEQIPFVKTKWHRYAGDLNRLPDDVDAAAVQDHKNPRGQYPRGFHWTLTTTNVALMKEPMPLGVHSELVEFIYNPFHAEIQNYHLKQLQKKTNVFHLDLHSMPSLGTIQHRDPGELRADVVISDQMGKSCSKEFRDLVLTSYLEAGFKVALNWPYYGGRITEQYGNPNQNIHVLQVELNRSLYMDEISKKWISEKAEKIIPKLSNAIEKIQHGLNLFAGGYGAEPA